MVASFELHRKTNLLLDVGFGSGGLLREAQRHGWDVHGVEVSTAAVERARGFGVKAHCGELESAAYSDGVFDVVVISELLEHLPDPFSLLRELHRILRPGGMCLATTPNGRGLSGRFLGARWIVAASDEHLHLFSAAALRKLFAGAGFSVITLKSSGIDPHDWIHLLDRQNGVHGHERVATAYTVGTALHATGPLRACKRLADFFLGLTGLGDSLKIRAQKDLAGEPPPFRG